MSCDTPDASGVTAVPITDDRPTVTILDILGSNRLMQQVADGEVKLAEEDLKAWEQPGFSVPSWDDLKHQEGSDHFQPPECDLGTYSTLILLGDYLLRYSRGGDVRPEDDFYASRRVENAAEVFNRFKDAAEAFERIFDDKPK